MRRRCTAREADDTTHAPRSSYDRWSAWPATPPAPAPAVQPRPQSISAAWARLSRTRRGFLAASSDSGAAAEGGRTVQRSPRPASLSSWLGPTFECEEPPGLSSWETDTVWDQTACRVAGSVRAPLSAFPPAFVEQALLPTNQLFFAQYSLAVEPDREQPRYVDHCAGALGGHGKRLWVSKLQ